MFSLTQTIGISGVAKRELVPFTIAFAIAEMFYKLGSFALECLAFLAHLVFVELRFRQAGWSGRS
ncbi:hypothetical protein [Mesorhizobium sp.]|uniref:hypothetical protein n=1 Tax=Mesorhizobium sp. TaxID=1871066 RepID=UPI000FE7FC7C|nr:hypothetical protein [Mesorhizobium sp.]RWI66746.1 MAG: hypothetical protein EOR19_31545 [Mesorhizobium sp.]TIN16151.1 MAG: hypothetical protein E5Y51_15490 [Mesorhizobium sp.]